MQGPWRVLIVDSLPPLACSQLSYPTQNQRHKSDTPYVVVWTLPQIRPWASLMEAISELRFILPSLHFLDRHASVSRLPSLLFNILF